MNKKDFAPLLIELKQRKLRAKRSIKESFDPKHYGQYPRDFLEGDSENRGIIIMCDLVSKRIKEILKNSK